MVRQHAAQHRAAESLPLVSKSATVTAVEAMDRDRREEVRSAVRDLAAERGFADAVSERGAVDWKCVLSKATGADSPGWLASRIGALRERYERSHPSLLRLEFETDAPFDFVAGQYVTIRYDDRSRPYSVASSPTRDRTELCIRRVSDGKLSPRLCEELEVGDRITVRGPNGHLLLEDPSNRDVAFLATGTGVAPLKSMLDYAFETGWDERHGERRDVWLFLGAAWADDLPYHDEFRTLASERDNFHYVPCVTREPWLTDWRGETDYIQEALLKYVDERALADAAFGRPAARSLRRRPATEVGARLDPARLEVYACGINAMVYDLESRMTRLGVPLRHVHCEGYG